MNFSKNLFVAFLYALAGDRLECPLETTAHPTGPAAYCLPTLKSLLKFETCRVLPAACKWKLTQRRRIACAGRDATHSIVSSLAHSLCIDGQLSRTFARNRILNICASSFTTAISLSYSHSQFTIQTLNKNRMREDNDTLQQIR